MCAGKIYITYPTTKTDTSTMVLSGFWLEHDYFVTCAHFFDDDISEEWREDALEELKTGSGTARVAVSSEVSSTDKGERKNHAKL